MKYTEMLGLFLINVLVKVATGIVFLFIALYICHAPEPEANLAALVVIFLLPMPVKKI